MSHGLLRRIAFGSMLLAGCAEPSERAAGDAAAPFDASARDASARDASARDASSQLVPPPAPVRAASVCGREGDDLLRDLFCAERPVTLEGLSDLQDALGIDPARNEVDRNFVVNGHTTALSTRSVSTVNPRVIFVQRPHEGEGREMYAVAFVRGEQTVELVARDRQTAELQFFLLKYKQACNYEPSGCSPGDLLTPETERGWRDVQLLDEEDLKNTALDCRHCHQPSGPGTSKLLRMHEVARPWTHWFDFTTEGGAALLADYFAMKGDEPLAGIPSWRLADALAAPLVGLVSHEGSPVQPNEFDSPRIETEVKASAPGQPFDNSTPGQSATWRASYVIASQGDAMAVPYHDVKVTDPDKLAAATEAYRRYLAGELSGDDLPDFRDIYSDDPQVRAEIGLATEPGLDARGILRQACAQCHNARLDQTLTRARFTADLDTLTREQRERAIERLSLPVDDPRAMPPAVLRALTDEARATLIDALREPD